MFSSATFGFAVHDITTFVFCAHFKYHLPRCNVNSDESKFDSGPLRISKMLCSINISNEHADIQVAVCHYDVRNILD